MRFHFPFWQDGEWHVVYEQFGTLAAVSSHAKWTSCNTECDDLNRQQRPPRKWVPPEQRNPYRGDQTEMFT